MRDKYTALPPIVKAATDADICRDCEEHVRIRLKNMLSIADAHSFRILTLALQKCTAKLDSLAYTLCYANEDRARVRGNVGKHCHGGGAAIISTELCVLSIICGVWPPSSINLMHIT